jgi:hypothetical protein
MVDERGRIWKESEVKEVPRRGWLQSRHVFESNITDFLIKKVFVT